tara:strand:- start:225 stop:797 length:573 start_codon:yes stop_codon:yes gene_type:complete
MRLRTNALLAAAALLVVGGGVFYSLNSKDHYDPSKYSATITPATASTSTPGQAKSGLQKGSRVELTLPDQFDAPKTIGPDVETLVLAFSKGAGGTVRNYLDKQEAEYWVSHNAIFIADISPIPVVIRNTLALPKLRKSSYSTLLLYEDEMSKALKRNAQGDLISIAKLKDNVVQSVRYIKTEAELASIFQ